MITIKTESGSEVLVSEEEFARVEKMLKDSGGNITGKMIGDILHMIPTRAEFLDMTNQIKANETLRDAAPDLLEACKAMIRYEDSRSVSASSYTGAIVLIRSAIAKAEGR